MTARAHYGSSTLGRTRQKTSSRRNVRRRAHSDDSFFSTGLILQEPQLQTVRGWLVFQVLALVLQFHFWQEVRGNLFVYEITLSSNCAPERTRHGICVGPLWNVSAWEDVVLQGRLSSFGELRTRPHYSYSSHMSRNHFDSIEAIDAEIAQLQQETALRLKELQDKRAELQVVQGLVPLGNGSSRSRGFNSTYIFQFETRSSPAVLLMSVDPVSRAPRIGEDPPQLTPAALDDEHEGHHWSLEVKRIEPPPTGLNFQRTGYGTRIMTIEDMSQEAVDAVRQHGHVRWEGILRNVEMSAHRTRFVIFVEDFQSHQDHLEKLTSAMSGTQCSLTASWRAFNRQHQGHRHRALTRCRDLLGCFLPLGALATWAVHARLVTRTMKALAEPKDMSPSMELTEDQAESQPVSGTGNAENISGNHFQTVIFIKLLVMDIPQQICIVLYLLGWYEADGLRCQLCLFHPQHCEDEHPFRLANSVAFLCTLLSSVTNQIILGPGKTSKAEDACGYWIIRIGLICVSILPFTTGVYWATSALLTLPALVKVFVFLPCVFGWFSVIACLLSGFVACCGDL